MFPEGVKYFAGDLSEQEQKVVRATHFAPAADLFTQKLDGVAWRSKPSSYILATVPMRKTVVLEPTIDAVRTPEPQHDLVWTA
jgi:hypothetical protein